MVINAFMANAIKIAIAPKNKFPSIVFKANAKKHKVVQQTQKFSKNVRVHLAKEILNVTHLMAILVVNAKGVYAAIIAIVVIQRLQERDAEALYAKTIKIANQKSVHKKGNAHLEFAIIITIKKKNMLTNAIFQIATKTKIALKYCFNNGA